MVRPLRTAFLAVLLCLPGTATCATSDSAPLALRDRSLANGLRVILLEDHRTPSVAIDVGYRVGGKDDPSGRSGFAHLFEHLMFKGTPNTKPETLDRLTEDVGGLNNAFTASDITDYYEVVPSNYLRTLLWAEADRLRALSVSQANMTTERDVVIGEHGQSVLAAPYGMLGEILEREAYTVHPYRRGVIGSPEELRAATLDDVVRFHDTFYRPDNAVLVVVGDFDAARASAWIDSYFSSIPRPSAPIPRVTAVEPPQTTERRTEYHGKNVPLPALAYAYHIGAATSVDAPALDVLAAILASGKSSRLYRSLVYDKQLASSVTASAEDRQQPSLFRVTAFLNAGKDPAVGEAALDAEIARIQSVAPTLEELETAKTRLASSSARALETNASIALSIVRGVIYKNDPNALASDSVRLRGVSADDVMRVARTYLASTNRTVLDYLPATGEASK